MNGPAQCAAVQAKIRTHKVHNGASACAAKLLLGHFFLRGATCLRCRSPPLPNRTASRAAAPREPESPLCSCAYCCVLSRARAAAFLISPGLLIALEINLDMVICLIHNISMKARIDGRANPEYFRAYYAKNKDKILAHNKKWRSTHRYKGIGNAQYRAIVISLLRQRDGDNCEICGLPIESGQESPDHIIQRAQGGMNEAKNIRLVHRACNQTRPKWNRRMQDRFCSFPGCGHPHHALDYCSIHYKRIKRNMKRLAA